MSLELRNYMKTAHPGMELSKPGYLKQRMKLNPLAFYELYRHHNRNFYAEPGFAAFHGYLVLAADGSGINIPISNLAEDIMSASELLSRGLMFPTPLAADTGSRTRTERISISPNGAFRRKKRDGRYWSAGLSETIYFLMPVTDPSLRFNPEWVEWLMGFPQGWTKISSGA